TISIYAKDFHFTNTSFVAKVTTKFKNLMNRTKGNSGNEGSIPVHNLPNSDTITPSVHIYRFKNEALRETGLGSMRPLPVTPLPTNTYHRHNYYEILFFEEGQGFHEIDFHTFYFQSPSVHFVAPGTVHLL